MQLDRKKEVIEKIRNLGEVADLYLKKRRLEANDDFGFICMTFLSKQTEHANSVIILENSRDTEIIARCMIEGQILLDWIRIKPEERALLWREYSKIWNLQLLEEKIVSGERLSLEMINEIKEAAVSVAHKFCKKPLSDEEISHISSYYFIDNYPNKRFVEIKKEVEGAGLDHKSSWYMYGKFSEWIHWRIGGISHSLKSQDFNVTFNADTDVLPILLCAFEYLRITLCVTLDHFGCDKGIAEVVEIETNLAKSFSIVTPLDYSF